MFQFKKIEETGATCVKNLLESDDISVAGNFQNWFED